VKVLLLGQSGQLGQALLAAPPDDSQLTAQLTTQLTTQVTTQVTTMSRQAMDLSEVDQIPARLDQHQPDLIINAAAYTQVDPAESEPTLAHRINAEAPARMAQWAARHQARLIHVSTDFVFDGQRGQAYRPDDPPAPLSVYGRSKLAGEQAVLASGARVVVLRTAWLYSAVGHNFAKTMLRLMAERDSLSIVSDQIGCPTHADSLARAIWRTAAHKEVSGIHHWSDAGVASWYDFALAIREQALARGLLKQAATIHPIPAREFPQKAPRPANSLLDCFDTRRALGLEAAHWREELNHMLETLSCADS